MEKINDAVSWYQNKIGTYDKQLWERSVEQKVLKSIQNVPKKATKVKHELIDVDLVRGSMFPKAKPQHSWFAVTRRGLLRVIFMPFFYQWWLKSTCRWMTTLLMVLYMCQVITMIVFVTDSSNQVNAEDLSLAHLVSPLVMMGISGLIHAHIVATQQSSRTRSRTSLNESTQRSREGQKDSTPLKKKRKDNKYSPQMSSSNAERDSGSHDTGIETNAEDGVAAGSLAAHCACNRKSKVYLRRKQGGSHRGSTGSEGMNLSIKKQVNEDADDETEEDNSSTHRDRSPVKSRTRSNWTPRLSRQDLEVTATEDALNDLVSSICTGREQVVYKNDSEQEEVAANSQECLDTPDRPFIGQLDNPVESTGEILLPENSAFLLNKDLQIPCDMPNSDSHCVGGAEERLENCVRSCDESKSSQCKAPNNAAGTYLHNSNDAACVDDLSLSTSEVVAPGNQPINATTPVPDVGQLATGLRQRLRNGRQGSPPVGSDLQNESGDVSNEPASILRPQSLGVKTQDLKESTGISSCESETEVSPTTPASAKLLKASASCSSVGFVRHRRLSQVQSGSDEMPSSEMEWDDTVNTDMTSCSDSSDSDNSSTAVSGQEEGTEGAPLRRGQSLPHVASIMNNLASSTDKVSCIIWEGDEVKKVDLTVLDVGWTIIKRVDRIPETSDYLVLGMALSFLLLLMPCAFRLFHSQEVLLNLDWTKLADLATLPQLLIGENWRQKVVVCNGLVQRFFLSFVFFFLLSVVEKTFKQRLLYAKHFCYLTSSRRAKKYELPHFRLNKVRNIKTWLSLRSYLKKRGPQRSVDSIVSAAFILAVSLVSVMCIQLLQDYGRFLEHLGNWELLVWAMALGLYLLRFITLGTKINKKYRNFAVLITEQINLYLHMEQKPHKKEELMLANNVLKLAEDLLKELESPFKISGLSANPFLYNITKVIILSAFSAVLTELLGFKLKLYKIKIRT